MLMRAFGKTGLQVSMLGFGGAEIGWEKDVTVTRVRDVLLPAIDEGLNVIDTACAYLDSERLIGEALGPRRKDVLLFTKCGAQEAFASHDWSRKGIFAQCEGSLKALRTDVLDLLQLHSCSVDELKTGEAVQALQDLKRQGKVRFIGYSGDAQPARFAVESGWFDVLQTSYNVVDQQAATLTIPLANEKGLGVIVKRPVANMAFRHGDTPPSNDYHRSYWERFRTLADAQFSPATVTQAFDTLLRFTIHQPGVHVAIVGTTKPGRFSENLRVAEKGPLPEADRARLVARFEQVGAHWPGQV
jgi:aryl-alcohol dehydrogenase-like predicted oxidoreductase